MSRLPWAASMPFAQCVHCRVAVVFAIQSWLAETPEQRRNSTTPAYFTVGMSSKSYPPLAIQPP